MEELENTNVTEETQVNDNQFYIDQLKELKMNSVSRDEYNKVLKDNQNLFAQLRDGFVPQTTVEAEAPKVDIDGLRRELYGNQDGADMTNLEYIEKTLKLRDAIIEQGGKDPFLPFGHDTIPTAADYERAERVANGLKQLVEDSEGDPAVFRAGYDRLISGR